MTTHKTNDSETKWTKEPWRRVSMHYEGADGKTVQLEPVSSVNHDDRDEIRMLKCVNFLAGHPDLEQVEICPKGTLEINLAQDCAVMSAALKRIADREINSDQELLDGFCEDDDAHGNYKTGFSDGLTNASAIALAALRSTTVSSILSRADAKKDK